MKWKQHRARGAEPNAMIHDYGECVVVFFLAWERKPAETYATNGFNRSSKEPCLIYFAHLKIGVSERLCWKPNRMTEFLLIAIACVCAEHFGQPSGAGGGGVASPSTISLQLCVFWILIKSNTFTVKRDFVVKKLWNFLAPKGMIMRLAGLWAVCMCAISGVCGRSCQLVKQETCVIQLWAILII